MTQAIAAYSLQELRPRTLTGEDEEKTCAPEGAVGSSSRKVHLTGRFEVLP